MNVELGLLDIECIIDRDMPAIGSTADSAIETPQTDSLDLDCYKIHLDLNHEAFLSAIQ